MRLPGSQLEDMCKKGRRDIVLAAPFIKVNTLGRLLEHIDEGVAVRCVTRWRPEEIVAGVSDLEVWPIVRGRANTSLWLCHELHAKYYRVDNTCLVGSANLTNAALGWSRLSNLELLVELPIDHVELQSFEAELLHSSIPVDEALYKQTLEITELLQKQSEIIPSLLFEHKDVEYEVKFNSPALSGKIWLPSLRQPADLFLAYQQRWAELTTGARIAAASDLSFFDLPPGLSKQVFISYMGLLLLQKPLVREIDSFLVTSQRFGAIRDLLNARLGQFEEDFDASRAWQTLMRWLLYFLPTRYERIPSRHSEVLRRISS